MEPCEGDFMRILIACIMFLMCGFAFADSDAIGILAGTQESVSLALYNSTGMLDENGACSIMIYDAFSLIIDSVPMVNHGNGLYVYVWDVPDSSGTYRILMNCTSLELMNYSAGGAVFVSPHSFEKTVAKGVVLNSPEFIERYEIIGDVSKTQVLSTPWLDISLGAGVLIIIVILLYNAYKKR